MISSDHQADQCHRHRQQYDLSDFFELWNGKWDLQPWDKQWNVL